MEKGLLGTLDEALKPRREEQLTAAALCLSVDGRRGGK
jgi:hypothetical protein